MLFTPFIQTLRSELLQNPALTLEPLSSSVFHPESIPVENDQDFLVKQHIQITNELEVVALTQRLLQVCLVCLTCFAFIETKYEKIVCY